MHRFYLPPEQCRDASLCLTDSEAHHALHVLRVRAGERIVVLDGAGHEYLCSVEDAARESVRLTVFQKTFVPPLPCQITLLQAVPKGKLFEDITEKATELGAARIVPILSERVTTRLDTAGATEKAVKWQRVAVEAIKQCGNPWLPQVAKPVTLAKFLARGEKFDLSLVASLESGSPHPREHFRAFAARHNRAPQTACVWVGPEGDFTPEEMNLLKREGVLPITLGRLILRTETAAVYCLAILNYELQSAIGDENR